jgi:IS605 OrfB family transposase
MKRSSKHILKYQTKYKTDILFQIEKDVIETLQHYVNLICIEELPLKKYISTSVLPDTKITHSQWKKDIYNGASSIIRSQLKKANSRRYKNYKRIYSKCRNRFKWFTNKKFSELKLKPILKSKYFTIPQIKKFSLILGCTLFNIRYGNHFDNWVRISLPWKEFNKWSETINISIKQHKQSLKFKEWKRVNSIRLLNKNDKFYIEFIYEKKEPKLKGYGKILGIDQGYKTLLTCSDGQVLGTELENLYHNISNKKQGSKTFKRLLVSRDNEINRICNQLNLIGVKEIVLEDLKYLKHKSKLSTKFMNTLQRWSYPKTMSKLESLCQTNGILVSKVNPAYTSQKCSCCGYVDKKNRNGSDFLCLSCSYYSNADFNAAKNLATMGVYSLHDLRKERSKNETEYA